MRPNRRALVRGLALLLAGAAAGFLLLMASCAIPSDALLDKAGDAVRVMEREDLHRRVDPLNRASVLDNYTDCLMLNEAFCDAGDSPASRAVDTAYYRVPGLSIPESFLAVYGRGSADKAPFRYIRYWHGYLAFLRPLLVLFTYSRLRWVNAVALALFLGGVLLLMRRRGLGGAIPSLLATVLCAAPLAVVQSLQYSSVAYAALLGMAALLLNRRAERVPCIFLLTGMAVGYLDLLTYPTLALTLPLTLHWLLLRRTGRPMTLRALLACAFAWGAGYGGMWAMKWCLGVAVYGRAGLDYILEAIAERSGGTALGVRVSRVLSLLKCFAQLFSNALGMVAAMICGAFALRHGGWQGLKRALSSARSAPLYAIAAIPIPWLLLLGNHTAQHSWMVYRNLCILVWVALILAGEGAEASKDAKSRGCPETNNAV